jgi:hypothetical protein
MSIHKWNSMEVARKKGGFAGAAENASLWDLSKRELVEISLRLASVAVGDESSLEDGRALARVSEERDALKASGVL